MKHQTKSPQTYIARPEDVVLRECENDHEQNDDCNREGPGSGPGVRVHLPMCAGSSHRGRAHDVTPRQDEVTALKSVHTS